MNKHFTQRVYLYIFFYDLIFAYPVYNLLFSRSGLSDEKISLLLAWWAIVAVVCEIPSGILADKWSKKWLIVIAPILKAICFGIWALFDGNFIVFGLGFLLWGGASTLLTGTFQSFVYDTLAHHKNEDDFARVLSNIYFWKRVGIAMGFILGGFLASIELSLPFYLSLIPLVSGFLLAFTFRDVPKFSQVEDEKAFGYLIRSIKDIKGSKEIQYLFLAIVVLGILGNLEEYDQLYFELVNLPIILFGIMAFLPSIFSAFVEGNSYRLKNKRWIFFILPILSGIFFLLTAFVIDVFSVAFLVVGYIVVSPLTVLGEAFIQEEIHGNNRATIISVVNFSKHLMGIVIYIIFALIIKYLQLPGIYLVTSIVLISFALYSIIIKFKSK